MRNSRNYSWVGIETLAVSQQPLLLVTDIPQMTGRRQKGPDETQLKAAYDAAIKVAESAAHISLKVLFGTTVPQVLCDKLLLASQNFPAEIMGGPLLTVMYGKNLEHPSTDSDDQMQFYSWTKQEAVGQPLQKANWIRWNEQRELCVLGYNESIVLCSIQPSFKVLQSFPIMESLEGMWIRGSQLVVVTQENIFSLIVMPQKKQPLVEVTEIASFSGAGTTALNTKTLNPEDVPLIQVRPPGLLNIIGVSPEIIWVADVFGRTIPISLLHPSLQTKALVAEGDFYQACESAQATIPPHLHNNFASYIIHAGPEAAREALKLNGLTIGMEFDLCIASKNLSRALACFRALITSCTTNNELNGVSVWDSRKEQDQFTPMASYDSYSGLAQVTSPQPSYLQEGAFVTESGRMVFSTIPGYDPETDIVRPDGDVNWDAPIVQYNSPEQVYTLDTRLVEKALQLVQLAEAEGAKGIQLEILNVLGVGHANQIPKQFVPQILLKMMQAGMGDAARQFGAGYNDGLVSQLLNDDFNGVSQQLVQMEFMGLASQHAISRGQQEAYQNVNEMSFRRSFERTFSDEIRST
eukprot:TRINITY_DN1808_c0_g3_i1.p1 TRINITY_DN1808_c0_g3~~TRINITY_DN1808_c0_g3_i1.p1  ORF type:complete len:580 (-),score=55.57 TRINITY_DN1808_c0_g3_i1:600-2339(-)